ncbi:MAG: hypothetical protein U0Y82_02815 [Thermoleophilia bacterium]
MRRVFGGASMMAVGVAALGAAATPGLGAVGWSAPQDVQVWANADTEHQLALDAAGTATLVGEATKGSQVVALRQPRNGAWSAPTVLGTNGVTPKLAKTAGGALVVWHGDLLDPAAPINHTVWAATGAADGTWTTAEQIATGITADNIAWLSANARGDAVVAVGSPGRDVATGNVILARQAGGPWAPLALGPVANWAQITVDAQGGMLATWRDGAPDETAGESGLRAAVRAPGAAAFTEITSPLGTGKALAHTQVSSPTGEAAVLAVDFMTAGETWLAAGRAAGAPFGPVTTIARIEATPTVAMGADGTAAVGIADSVDKPTVSVRPPGGAFGAPVRVGSTTGNPVVGVGSDGTVVAAWSSPPGTASRNVRVWASVRAPGGSFAAPELVGSSPLPMTVQNVAVGSGGVAVVTTRASGGSRYVIQAARRGPNPLITAADAQPATGGLRVHVRLGAAAHLTLRLARQNGTTVLMTQRFRRAGDSTMLIGSVRRIPAGRYRLQILARGTRVQAAATALLTVPKGR